MLFGNKYCECIPEFVFGLGPFPGEGLQFLVGEFDSAVFSVFVVARAPDSLSLGPGVVSAVS